MEYMHAAMLLHKAGKKIDEEHMTKVLTAVSVTIDHAKIKAIVSALDGVNIDEEIKNASAVVASTHEAKVEKKEEKKEEKKVDESAAAAGLGSLFG
ncbi:50S ribosomal protein P1 [Candidatus Woesearchaeota archaeon]|nr:50S ribosomal protein P1 [Candidatus Woesearchaeota archaeon]